MFSCPACRALLDETNFSATSQCPRCQLTIENIDGIPLLVRDRQMIEETIANARRQGLDAWYTKPQLGQWVGPYRHHIRKRKKWIEGVLAERKLRDDREPAVGLDLGCGDGSNLQWLHLHFSRLYGSDYNMLRLLRAAKLGIDARLFMADICNYPVEDNCFDVIFFNHVLEHIPDDATALREVRRILKPGGLLILGVPNEGAAFWQLAYRLQPRIRATSDHVQYYTADSIAVKCEAAGLTVQKVHPIGWGVPHWTLDALIRRFKWVDDGLEKLGRRFFPGQATSLYLLLSK
jgi:SAM-dependent methyltransferase